LCDPDPPELERMLRVGQFVTWPKLHMIENRHRIENEVLLGRQAVRRALQSREKSREAAKLQSDTGPVPTTSEAPMSMDTDAEDAFKKGSRWFFKRDANKSGSSTPRNRETPHPNGVATQPPSWRGSWPPSFFYTQEANHPPTATEQTQPSSEGAPQNLVSPPSPSIFNRIRRKSVLSSPFSTLRHTAARIGSRPTSEHGAGDARGSWSSDTSSGEDLPSPEWRGSRHQQFLSPVSFEDVDDVAILSSADDEADDDSRATMGTVAEGPEPN